MSSAQSIVNGVQSRVSSVRTGKKRAHDRASSAQCRTNSTHNGVSTGTTRTSGTQSRLPEAIGIPLDEQGESGRATEGLPGLGELIHLSLAKRLAKLLTP